MEKPEEAVLRLVVDDGVPTRGHRTNIFNDEFKLIGIGLHDHPTYTDLIVLNFAGGIIPLGKKSKASFGKFNRDKEETKTLEDTDDTDDIKVKDCPKSIQDQIKKMGLTSGYTIKLVGGQYRIDQS